MDVGIFRKTPDWYMFCTSSSDPEDLRRHFGCQSRILLPSDPGTGIPAMLRDHSSWWMVLPRWSRVYVKRVYIIV